MEPSLRHIRYFIATAEAGQISRAANNINVSQSAITSAIQNLEQGINAPLFERHPGGVTLTYEGNLFLEHARDIMASVEEAVSISRRSRDDVKGHFHLAVTYTVSGYYLPGHLMRFSRAFPNVDVKITEAARDDIEDGLVDERFDLALMLTSNIVNQEDLSYHTLLRSKRRLWVNAQHRFLKQDSVGLRDVAQEPYIMLTVDEASNTAHRYWKRGPYRPDTRFRTSSVEAVRSMVASGMGIAILSDMVYRPWSLEGRRVEVVDVADTIPTMDVGVVWSGLSKPGDAAQAFIDFMRLGSDAD
ncbi:MAG: LysR family transcriptional regulator [Pseudomonadota bacterium]